MGLRGPLGEPAREAVPLVLDSRLNFAKPFFGPIAVLFPRGTYAYRRCLRRASSRDCTTPGLVRGAIQVRYSSEVRCKVLGEANVTLFHL